MKYFFKKLCLLKKDDSGAVIILVALLLVVLMGMAALAVDGGMLYQTRRELVNAADSAALAGAQELIFNNNNSQVETFAENFALNNYNCDAAEATVLSSNTVGVETYKTVDYYFAGVLGFTSTEVSAYAEAEFTPLVLGANIVPWGVPEGFIPEGWKDEDCPHCELTKEECDCCQLCGENSPEECVCEEGDEYIILQVGPPGGGGPGGEIGPGNFHSLALGGQGANVYEENIKHGYKDEINIGDCLDTEPGNIAGKTGTGVNYRIDQCNASNHTKSGGMCDDRSCPRYVVTPVFDESVTDAQGKDCIVVIGFATFYLVDYYKVQSTHIVRALFVEEFIAEGEGAGDNDSNSDFGTYNLRLIK